MTPGEKLRARLENAGAQCMTAALLFTVSNALAGWLAAALLGQGAGEAAVALGNLCAGAAGFVPPLLLLRGMGGIKPASVHDAAPARVRPVLACLLPAVMLAGNLAFAAAKALLAPLGYRAPAQAALPQSGAALALSAAAMCLVPALGEEILVRGFMMTKLVPAGPVAAAVGSAALFALLHGDAAQAASAFVGGLFLAYAAQRWGLGCSMKLHLANNLIAFAAMLAGQRLGPAGERLAGGLLLAAVVPGLPALVWAARAGWFASRPVKREKAPSAAMLAHPLTLAGLAWYAGRLLWRALGL